MGDIENIWTIIFLIVAGQGLFISFFLFLKKSTYRYSNLFLAVLLLLFSFNLIENVAFWTGFIMRFPHLANTTLGFVYLYGPLFYFFIAFRHNAKTQLAYFDFLHLIPFLLFMFRIHTFFMLSGESKIHFLKNQNLYIVDFWTYFWQLASPTLLIIYLVFTFRKVIAGNNKIKPLERKMFVFFTLFSFSIACYFVSNILVDLKVEFDYIIMLIISLLIYQIGYYALTFPNIFDPSLYRTKSRVKYEKSSLTKKESLNYLRRFESLMEDEKLYLNKNLKMSEVANFLSISTNHLSQTLNERNNRSFIEIVNFYRIEEAKKKLLNKKYDNFTFEAIALECGFNNKASFNKYFKNFTKMTPKEFKMIQIKGE